MMKQRGQLKDYRGKWQEHKIWQMETKYLFIGLMLEILLKKISSFLSSVIKKRIISMQKPNMV